jgi:hypothetical protein
MAGCAGALACAWEVWVFVCSVGFEAYEPVVYGLREEITRMLWWWICEEPAFGEVLISGKRSEKKVWRQIWLC